MHSVTAVRIISIGKQAENLNYFEGISGGNDRLSSARSATGRDSAGQEDTFSASHAPLLSGEERGRRGGSDCLGCSFLIHLLKSRGK